ncbi:PAS and ANTAR domain-containing protein [Cellulosimicrobium funkei]|uniref:PAS and ANTAR domain-containing protein n=1 Tax=Cellulosimicrobium funkei TaxID=264251 RepID=UPI003667B523
MDAALPADATEPDDVVPPALADLLAALGPGDPQPVGRFRVDIATDTWWWSDEVYEMHGFAPGEVVPTTALVLSHKHPEDRERVASELAQAARTGEPFGSMHRIVDATGATRTLAVAAQGKNPGAELPWAHVVGYFVDLTTAQAEAARREATASIRAADASRSVIEQAKGVLMAALRTGPDGAFEVLRRRSNDVNVPVRELARRLVEGVVDGAGTAGPLLDESVRLRVDTLLEASCADEPGAGG